jgi:hypothetical protein
MGVMLLLAFTTRLIGINAKPARLPGRACASISNLKPPVIPAERSIF